MSDIENMDERLRATELTAAALNEAKEQLGARIDAAQTNTLRWSITLIGFITFAFTAVVGITRFDDIQELNRFKDEIRELAFGSPSRPPVLQLLHANGLNLDKSQVTAKVETYKDGDPELIFEMILKNTGGSRSGGMFAKIYTGPEVQQFATSSDEDHYAWESFSRGKDQTVSEIPAGASVRWKFFIKLPKGNLPKTGATTVSMVKFYYGVNLVSKAEFSLKVLF